MLQIECRSCDEIILNPKSLRDEDGYVALGRCACGGRLAVAERSDDGEEDRAEHAQFQDELASQLDVIHGGGADVHAEAASLIGNFSRLVGETSSLHERPSAHGVKSSLRVALDALQDGAEKLCSEFGLNALGDFEDHVRRELGVVS